MAAGSKIAGPFRGWIASLSTGQTVLETPDRPGEPSAWQKLRLWCYENKVHLTQLRLQLGAANLIGLPHKSCRGYGALWNVDRNLVSGAQIISRGVGSVIGDQVYIIWISQDGHIKPELVPLAKMAVHCILKEG